MQFELFFRALILFLCTMLAAPHAGAMTPYEARFGRARPVIAVIGQNAGTELTDYVIPYAVLARSGAADVHAIAMQAGPMTMTPATLRIQPESDAAQFDARFPQGADYVIVPKVNRADDPALLAWLRDQSRKGATVVSICDGALAVAASGLFDGRRATAHWFTEPRRLKDYPNVKWTPNLRYVADGKVMSSAGISAAMPTALALVEAIAGKAQAQRLADELGVADWSARHDSDGFRAEAGNNRAALDAALGGGGLFSRKDTLAIALQPGIDDIALALAVDAYSRTGRSRIHASAEGAAPVRTRDGLMVLPEQVTGDKLTGYETVKPGRMFDWLLADIGRRYGPLVAQGVALIFEYPALAASGG